MSLEDRHLYGAAAAACAACCAAPVLTLFGIAGAAATAATLLFAGLIFAVVVGAGAVFAVWTERRRTRHGACAPSAAPADLELSVTRSGQEDE